MNIADSIFANAISNDERLRTDFNSLKLNQLIRGTKIKAGKLSDEDVETIKDIWSTIKDERATELLIKLAFHSDTGVISAEDSIDEGGVDKIKYYVSDEALINMTPQVFKTKHYLIQTYPNLIKQLMMVNLRKLRVKAMLSDIMMRGYLKNNKEWFLIKLLVIKLDDYHLGKFIFTQYEQNYLNKLHELKQPRTLYEGFKATLFKAFKFNTNQDMGPNTPEEKLRRYINKRGHELRRMLLRILFNYRLTTQPGFATQLNDRQFDSEFLSDIEGLDDDIDFSSSDPYDIL